MSFTISATQALALACLVREEDILLGLFGCKGSGGNESKGGIQGIVIESAVTSARLRILGRFMRFLDEK